MGRFNGWDGRLRRDEYAGGLGDEGMGCGNYYRGALQTQEPAALQGDCSSERRRKASQGKAAGLPHQKGERVTGLAADRWMHCENLR